MCNFQHSWEGGCEGGIFGPFWPKLFLVIVLICIMQVVRDLVLFVAAAFRVLVMLVSTLLFLFTSFPA